MPGLQWMRAAVEAAPAVTTHQCLHECSLAHADVPVFGDVAGAAGRHPAATQGRQLAVAGQQRGTVRAAPAAAVAAGACCGTGCRPQVVWNPVVQLLANTNSAQALNRAIPSSEASCFTAMAVESHHLQRSFVTYSNAATSL